MSGETLAPTQSEPELKRVMGPRLLLLFIVGDILGTGVYALTGSVAGEVGGAAWVPFVVAFVVATLTAFSYLELVTKYPQAAGAALYVHRAFGVHFVTFLVCFTVMCSGITSASTASRAFAAFFVEGFGLNSGETMVMLIALAFMTAVAAINLRGVSESVRANVVLTLVELAGLLIVILVGVWAMTQGEADFSQVTMFDTSEDKTAFLAVTTATTLAFFALVGFEDAVNMAEETKDPVGTFPKVMLTGLGITGLIYVLVAISAVAIVPVGELAEAEATALLRVVETGAPGIPIDEIFPFIAMFAVANTALINMLMASRLLYGMAKEDVLPRPLARVHAERRTPYVSIVFTTLISFGLIIAVTRFVDTSAVATLGGTTALLLLAVFTLVHISVLVLRRRPIDRKHFRAPTVVPVIGMVACAFFVGPWTGRDSAQYAVALVLLVVGIVLWVLTWAYNRGARGKKTGFRHPEQIGG